MGTALVAIVVSILTCFANNWYNHNKLRADLSTHSKKTYKELITSERIKWVDALREAMADFLSKSHEILVLKFSRLRDEEARKIPFATAYNDLVCYFLKTSYLIQLRLNPKETAFLQDLDEMSQKILSAETVFELSEAQKDIKDFADMCQGLLKAEWERIKEESQPT